MKTCFKCKQDKPMDEFYAHPEMADGHLGKCKECTKSDVHANYHENIDVWRERERKRYQSPKRKAKVLGYQRIRRAKYPIKDKARCAVSRAVRNGGLIRQPCEVCGNTLSQGHHDDYSKPLEVRWLCHQHHREVHGQIANPEYNAAFPF